MYLKELLYKEALFYFNNLISLLCGNEIFFGDLYMVENTKQTTVIHFVADGEVREFHFNFQIFEAGDIDVYLDEKLTDTGYNVSVDEEIGGKVIFNQPPANGTRITIIRNFTCKNRLATIC